MNTYTLESFINFCDGMQPINESYSSYNRSQSICEMLDSNAVHIRKTKSSNGIIVFYTDRYCAVISDKQKINNQPLFLLVREISKPTKDFNPYEKWTQVVGKQIKKDESSKYFVQPLSLHFKNGKFDNKNTQELEKLVIEADRLISLL